MIFARRRYFTDNYVYLLAEGADAVLVDPADPAAALDLARAHGVRPRAILHTHGHGDHSGGSDKLRRALGAKVYGHGADRTWFAPDVDLAGAETVEVGALSIGVHPVPGHTPGSVLYSWRGRLLTGDTLFWGGCGNCKHGGDPGRLATSFLEVIARLDGALEVHPGHDYAGANMPFVLDLEPGNAAARARLVNVREDRAAGREPRPTTLAEERTVNPFLRAGSAAIAAALAAKGIEAAGPREVFLALRRLRDAW